MIQVATEDAFNHNIAAAGDLFFVPKSQFLRLGISCDVFGLVHDHATDSHKVRNLNPEQKVYAECLQVLRY